MDHHSRKNDFEEFYGNNGDPATVLADVVQKIGSVLTMIVGSDLADKAMTTAISRLGGEGHWRERIESERYGLFSELPFGERLFLIAAYAQYGIDFLKEPGDTVDTSEKRIKSIIEDTDAFLKAVDLAAWLGEGRDADLEKIASMARARWALDHSEPVLAEDLAALGGISAGRMRGLARKDDSGKLKMNEQRMIPAGPAIEWLKGQSAYMASIWKDGLTAINNSGRRIDDPVFIPVSADGSRFTPELDQGNGYLIGPTGEQTRVHDFKKALDQMVHMDPAAWRRPSPKSGKASTVVAVDWVRVSAASIGL